MMATLSRPQEPDEYDRKVIAFCRSFADACGYPPESFVGKNHFDLYPNPENEAIFRKVADSGPGVAENLRKKIFDPFFTTKDLGTGIGFPSKCRIVKGHRGTIGVGTSRFGWAEFTVRLPLSSVEEIPEPAAPGGETIY